MGGSELLNFLPQTIVSQLLSEDARSVVPRRHEMETVVLFADISGFTALAETMNKKHKERGPEYLSEYLNKYFSLMVKTINSEGGDVFKFAGDAMIVLWPIEEEFELAIFRAVQCAISIQEQLSSANLAVGVILDVKVGISVGRVSILHMGGMLGRMEYVVVGPPLTEALEAEHHAEKGQINISKTAWPHLVEFFESVNIYPDGVVHLNKEIKKKSVKKSRISRKSQRNDNAINDPIFLDKVRHYVPSSIVGYVKEEYTIGEVWWSDMRPVSVLFVNLGLKDYDLFAAGEFNEALNKVHDVLLQVQMAVYKHEGSINKFLLDDKGSTLIGCFGLPPGPHEDDPIRAVLTALAILASLESKWKLIASIGITTGIVFCGVAGSFTRKEYTVLGDSVNLSARLMQYSGRQGGGVIVDSATWSYDPFCIEYRPLEPITVKGKTEPVLIYRPYPRLFGDNPVPKDRTDRKKEQFKIIYNQQMSHFLSASFIRPKVFKDIKILTRYGMVPQQGSTRTMNSRHDFPYLVKYLKYIAVRGTTIDMTAENFNPVDRSERGIPLVDAVSVGVPQFESGDAESIGTIVTTCGASHRVSKFLDSFKELHLQICVTAQDEIKNEDAAADFASSHVLNIATTDICLPIDCKLSLSKYFQMLVDWSQPQPSAFIGRDGHIIQLLCYPKSKWSGLQSDRSKVIQAIHMAVFSLMEHNEGRSILVEGWLGTGKSHLLRSVMTELKDIACVEIVGANGDRFQRSIAFQAIIEVIRGILNPSQSPDYYYGEAIKVAIHTYAPELTQYNYLLGTIFNFPEENDVTRDSGPSEERFSSSQTTGIQHLLLFALLQGLSTSNAKKLICLIDDGSYMHSSNWDLLQSLTSGGASLQCLLHTLAIESPSIQGYFERIKAGLNACLPIIFIVASRQLHWCLDYNMLSLPESYVALRDEMQGSCYFRLDKLSSSEMDRIIDDSVTNVELSTAAKLQIRLASESNPLHLIEVLINLLSLLPSPFLETVEDGGKSPTARSKISLDFPPAFDLHSQYTIITSNKFTNAMSVKFDRLSTVKQLILKTAALVSDLRFGRESDGDKCFTFPEVELWYPVEKQRSFLKEDFSALVEGGYVVKMNKKRSSIIERRRTRTENTDSSRGSYDASYSTHNSGDLDDCFLLDRYVYVLCKVRITKLQRDKVGTKDESGRGSTEDSVSESELTGRNSLGDLISRSSIGGSMPQMLESPKSTSPSATSPKSPPSNSFVSSSFSGFRKLTGNKTMPASLSPK